ncbi:MAG: hypothetical protein HQL95_00180 [Magnetococcales bacterium]|nr:hypothetical protein [Magnetococcales bacterium]
MNACHSLDISSLLKAIRVRPIEHHEQARWYELLAQHHYLGAPAKVGKSLLHVATLNEQWVALLAHI